MGWVGLMGFDFAVFVLEFFFEYLFFECLPLIFSENASVVFLSYLHLCIGYLDYRAAGALGA